MTYDAATWAEVTGDKLDTQWHRRRSSKRSLEKMSVLPMDGNLDASFCRGRARWPSQPSCKPSALLALKLGNHGFVCHHPNVLCTTFDLSEPMRPVAWRFSHLLHQQSEVY